MPDQFEEKLAATRARFTHELSSIRTGRANPIMLEGMLVESYGAKTPLKGLANITVADARMLTIEPWDKSITKEIEKAIVVSDLGVAPVVDGSTIRVTLPEMTEETRTRLVKSVHAKLEEARIAVRQARDAAKKKIDADLKEKTISEDDRRDRVSSLDEKTKIATAQLEADAKEKERAIMTV